MPVLKRIHINGAALNVNRGGQRGSEREPPLSVHAGGKIHRAFELVIEGPSLMRYAPDEPLPGGATLWIETAAPVAMTTRTGQERLA